jgi:hypothetical protein
VTLFTIGRMAKAPKRHGRPKKARPYVVDGKDYSVAISDTKVDDDGNVPLRISFRAEFGNRSVCQVRGVTNRSFWHDYPQNEAMRAAAISITPQVISELIRFAHRQGWDPVASRSNFELLADRDDIKKLLVQEG